MPAYDYKCLSCDRTATVISSIKEDKTIPTCHKCKSQMSRDYTFGSVLFRGDGFYSTDK